MAFPNSCYRVRACGFALPMYPCTLRIPIQREEATHPWQFRQRIVKELKARINESLQIFGRLVIGDFPNTNNAPVTGHGRGGREKGMHVKALILVALVPFLVNI